MRAIIPLIALASLVAGCQTTDTFKSIDDDLAEELNRRSDHSSLSIITLSDGEKIRPNRLTVTPDSVMLSTTISKSLPEPEARRSPRIFGRIAAGTSTRSEFDSLRTLPATQVEKFVLIDRGRGAKLGLRTGLTLGVLAGAGLSAFAASVEICSLDGSCSRFNTGGAVLVTLGLGIAGGLLGALMGFGAGYITRYQIQPS
jgi:hypothetical protein